MVPDQAPLATHDVASVLDQDSVVDPPRVRLVGEALNVSVGAGSLTVSVADPVPLPAAPVQLRPYT